MPLTRRDFLHVAGAGALVSLRAGAAPPPAGHERVQPAAADGWFDRPMRWVQLTLVENDPGRFERIKTCALAGAHLFGVAGQVDEVIRDRIWRLATIYVTDNLRAGVK